MDEDFNPSTNPGPPAPPRRTDIRNRSTVLVVDAKPLSLLATAGVLHHAGLRCICARTTAAVLRACDLPTSLTPETLLAEMDDLAGEVARAVQPLRVDEPREGVSVVNPATKLNSVTRPGAVDLIVWDVGEEVTAVLETLSLIRRQFPDLPAVLLSDPQWAGLEKKTEGLSAATRCLFKPIDPASLVSVCEPLLWMPALQAMHRQRGSRPSRPGWVTL